jgi:hypothetical protein
LQPKKSGTFTRLTDEYNYRNCGRLMFNQVIGGFDVWWHKGNCNCVQPLGLSDDHLLRPN